MRKSFSSLGNNSINKPQCFEVSEINLLWRTAQRHAYFHYGNLSCCRWERIYLFTSDKSSRYALGRRRYWFIARAFIHNCVLLKSSSLNLRCFLFIRLKCASLFMFLWARHNKCVHFGSFMSSWYINVYEQQQRLRFFPTHTQKNLFSQMEKFLFIMTFLWYTEIIYIRVLELFLCIRFSPYVNIMRINDFFLCALAGNEWKIMKERMFIYDAIEFSSELKRQRAFFLFPLRWKWRSAN